MNNLNCFCKYGIVRRNPLEPTLEFIDGLKCSCNGLGNIGNIHIEPDIVLVEPKPEEGEEFSIKFYKRLRDMGIKDFDDPSDEDLFKGVD